MSASHYQQHSPPAQCVKAVKANGVCEGQALQHCSLNSVDRLQEEGGEKKAVQQAFREECDRLRGTVTEWRRGSRAAATASLLTWSQLAPKKNTTSWYAGGTNMASVVAVFCCQQSTTAMRKHLRVVPWENVDRRDPYDHVVTEYCCNFCRKNKNSSSRSWKHCFTSKYSWLWFILELELNYACICARTHTHTH